MDATVLLTVNIMDNIFTIERCVPRSSRSGSRSRRSGSAMAKMSRRAISCKMYKADVEVDKSRRQDVRGQYMTFWMNGQIKFGKFDRMAMERIRRPPSRRGHHHRFGLTESFRRHPREGRQYFKVWLGGLVEAPHNSRASIRRDSINQRFSVKVELIPSWASQDYLRRGAP